MKIWSVLKLKEIRILIIVIHNNSSCGSTDQTVTNENEDVTLDFKEKIMCWSVKHCITRRALNDLLSILVVYGFSFLPKDSRTLMKTPVNVDIRKLSKGKLWYYGIKSHLQLIFQNIRSDIKLTLDFNFDGVELFNSSKKCFWPIIASIRGENILFFFACNSKLCF